MNNEFELLSQEDQEFVQGATDIAKLLIWQRYSKKYGVALKDFKYDENCVKYIEDYLAQAIRTRILKWKNVSGRITLTRVKTQGGFATSSETQIHEILKSVLTCSILFGQCLATLLQGKWVRDVSGELRVDTIDAGVLVNQKCLKYVTIGNEDRLTSFVAALGNSAQIESITGAALLKLNLTRQDYKKVQAWTDGNGKLENLIVIGHNDEVMHNIVVDSSQV